METRVSRKYFVNGCRYEDGKNVSSKISQDKANPDNATAKCKASII